MVGGYERSCISRSTEAYLGEYERLGSIPSTILVSFMDGYAFGPPIFDQPIVGGRAGTHGAMLESHSYGVYMTDFMKVDDFSRPGALVEILARAEEAKRKGIKLFPFIK